MKIFSVRLLECILLLDYIFIMRLVEINITTKLDFTQYDITANVLFPSRIIRISKYKLVSNKRIGYKWAIMNRFLDYFLRTAVLDWYIP